MAFGFGLGLGFAGRQSEKAAAAPDPVPAPVSVTTGGSLRFPENNNETSVPGFRGFLVQPDSPTWLRHAGAVFTILHLPRSRRADNRRYAIYGLSETGKNTCVLSLHGSAYHDSALRNRFRFLARDWHGDEVDLLTPVWDTDAALVVMTFDGLDAACDWYSLTGGTRHAGPVSTGVSAFNGMSWPSDWLIGGAGTTIAATGISRPHGYFPGEIAAMGYFEGSPTVADWQAIAQGADPLARLGASGMLYYRRFDGSAASYGPPPAATADASANCIPVDAPNLAPGSSFWRGGSGLSFKPVPTRHVFGLLAGQVSRAVPFSGSAAPTHEGAVIEIQVFDAATGAVALDWTECATVTAGAWSGAVTVPKSATGWVHARARIRGSSPEIQAMMMAPFAVGWKFAIFGGSQMQRAATGAGHTGTPDGATLASAGIRAAPMDDPWLELVRVRDINLGDANVAFRKQFDAYGDRTPICVCWYAEDDTDTLDMIDDTAPGRTWANVAGNAAIWGADISAAIWNRGAGTPGDRTWADIYDAVFDGTGPAAADHALADLFPAGFGRILSPLTRASTTLAGPFASDRSAGNNDRHEQVAYAKSRGWTVGPHVYMQITPGGGALQDGTVARGNPLIGNRLAIAAARHVGLDSSANPHLAGTATFNSTRNTITVPVTLPNGGTLTAAAPNAITGFEVDDGGAGNWTRSGFSAAISGADIVLTRDGGAWQAGTRLRFMPGGPLSYGTTGPSETALLDGVPHETYALDAMGWGLPVDGMGPVAITVA